MFSSTSTASLYYIVVASACEPQTGATLSLSLRAAYVIGEDVAACSTTATTLSFSLSLPALDSPLLALSLTAPPGFRRHRRLSAVVAVIALRLAVLSSPPLPPLSMMSEL